MQCRTIGAAAKNQFNRIDFDRIRVDNSLYAVDIYLEMFNCVSAEQTVAMCKTKFLRRVSNSINTCNQRLQSDNCTKQWPNGQQPMVILWSAKTARQILLKTQIIHTRGLSSSSQNSHVSNFEQVLFHATNASSVKVHHRIYKFWHCSIRYKCRGPRIRIKTE